MIVVEFSRTECTLESPSSSDLRKCNFIKRTTPVGLSTDDERKKSRSNWRGNFDDEFGREDSTITRRCDVQMDKKDGH